MKKVLIITYYWPPSGGSGVQRWLKLVKFLSRMDIEPIVLTVSPKTASFPIFDESLSAEIPENLQVHYADAKGPFGTYQKLTQKPIPKSGFSGEKKPNLLDKFFRFIRGNFFIPDARKGWNKHAIVKARQIIKSEGINTVITTSPPHSTQLIGLRLKKELNMYWICDLRDPWTGLFYNKQLYRSLWARKRDKAFESKCIRSADKVIVVSPSMAESLKDACPDGKNKIHLVTNGFDPEDFKEDVIGSSEMKYISYVGNLGEQFPINEFLLAFSELCKQDPLWKLRFIGNVAENVLHKVKEYKLEEEVEYIPYVKHKEAIAFMRSSRVLLLIIPNIEENKGILTGKLFEYIASEKPILLLGPKEGDASKILSNFPNSRCFDYNERIELQKTITEMEQKKTNLEQKRRYSREYQAESIKNFITNQM